VPHPKTGELIPAMKLAATIALDGPRCIDIHCATKSLAVDDRERGEPCR